MTALLWMLLLLVLPAVSELPTPVDVTMVTTGFSQVVQWKPGPGTPAQASYCVSITTERGVSEDVVSGCEHVQHPLLCNLTEVFSDPTETYIIMVRAALDERASPPAFTSRYKPIDHMALPLLNVAPCGRDLCVDLQPPHERYRKIYSVLSYHLHVEGHGEEAPFFIKSQSLRRKTLKDLTPGRRYCVSVSFWDILEETKSNFSRPVCCSTLAVHSGDSGVVLVLLVLLVLLVAGGSVFLVLKGLVSLSSPLPSVLTSIRHAEGDMAAPCSASLSSLWIVKSCDGEESQAPSTTSTPARPCRTHPPSSPTSSGHRMDQSSGSAYNQTTITTSLLSSSSSSSPPSSSSTHQQSSPRSHVFVDGEGGDNQDINLLSLRLGRFEDMEDQEEFNHTGDFYPSPTHRSSSAHCPSPTHCSSLCPSSSRRLGDEDEQGPSSSRRLGDEGAIAAASGWTDDEEADCGYLPHTLSL